MKKNYSFHCPTFAKIKIKFSAYCSSTVLYQILLKVKTRNSGGTQKAK